MRKLLTLFAALFSTTAFGAITVDTSGDGSLTGGGTSVVVTPDATVSNNSIIYVMVAWESNNGASVVPASYSPASGFSNIATVTNVNDFSELTVYEKVAGGSEPSSYTFSWTETTSGDTYGAEACLIAFAGADTGTPSGTPVTQRDGTSNTTYEIPALTTSNNNSADVAFVSEGGGSSSVTVGTWGDSLVEVRDSNNGDFSHCSIAWVVRATAGAQAATETIGSNSGTSHAVRIEVNESSSSSVVPLIHHHNQMSRQ